MPLLTIAIPTYNRAEKLHAQLQRVCPQIIASGGNQVELIVLDNASTDHTQRVMVEMQKEFPWIQFVRNVANIGLIGNSLRLFEYGRGEYIWTLCDDDQIKEGAIAGIVEEIQAHPKAIYISFCLDYSYVRPSTIIVDTMEEALTLEQNAFFTSLSASVFQRSFVIQRLRFAYVYASSWVPFFVPYLMSGSEKHGEIVLSSRILANGCQKTTNDQWSKLDVSLQIRSILELPLTPRLRRVLKHGLDSFSFSMFRLYVDSLIDRNPSRWYVFREYVKRRSRSFSPVGVFWLLAALAGEHLNFFPKQIICIAEFVLRRPLLIKPEGRFDRC